MASTTRFMIRKTPLIQSLPSHFTTSNVIRETEEQLAEAFKSHLELHLDEKQTVQTEHGYMHALLSFSIQNGVILC
jgi:hypothetical protein